MALDFRDDELDEVVMPGESPYSDKKLNTFKLRLEEERNKVLSCLGNHVSLATEDATSLPDEIDQAARHTDQAYLLRLADKEHKQLAQIDRALGKIADGSYGLCEGTGEPIDERRLELRPWTRYSIEYKEQLELEKRNRKYR